MAELLLNPEDRRTKTEKMQDAGVSRKTFYAWMKDKRFITYLNSQLEQYTDGELAGVWRALINQCMRGNVSAMKLFFELKEMHPDIKIRRESLELARIKSGDAGTDNPGTDDGFIDALNAEAAKVWNDE